jgi:hypothetical protein
VSDRLVCVHSCKFTHTWLKGPVCTSSVQEFQQARSALQEMRSGDCARVPTQLSLEDIEVGVHLCRDGDSSKEPESERIPQLQCKSGAQVERVAFLSVQHT